MKTRLAGGDRAGSPLEYAIYAPAVQRLGYGAEYKLFRTVACHLEAGETLFSPVGFHSLAVLGKVPLAGGIVDCLRYEGGGASGLNVLVFRAFGDFQLAGGRGGDRRGRDGRLGRRFRRGP